MTDHNGQQSETERRNALNSRLRQEAMAGARETPAGRAHAKSVDAIRLLLAAFGGEQPPDGSGIDQRSLKQFSESLSELEAIPGSLYQLAALAAGAVRWVSRETGRTEAEILEELDS
jgi:hypothetical protein